MNTLKGEDKTEFLRVIVRDHPNVTPSILFTTSVNDAARFAAPLLVIDQSEPRRGPSVEFAGTVKISEADLARNYERQKDHPLGDCYVYKDTEWLKEKLLNWAGMAIFMGVLVYAIFF